MRSWSEMRYSELEAEAGVLVFGWTRSRSLGQRGIVEWVPGKWWVVEVTHQDGSFTPLHEGKGATEDARAEDCIQWLKAQDNASKEVQ